MESEWRSLIWDLSMGWSNWRLCAPLLGVPGIYVVGYTDTRAIYGLWSKPGGLNRLPTLVANHSTAGLGNFPYQQNVVPDH